MPSPLVLVERDGDVATLTLNDPERRNVMGAKARDYVLREADSRVCLRRLEAFYAGVAGRHARNGWDHAGD